MKRGRGRLSKKERRERGRRSVTYASPLFYNNVPLRQIRFLGCSGWKNDFSTYSNGCHRHTHTANRRRDNVYATAVLDARTVQWLLTLGPSTQNVAALHCKRPKTKPTFLALKKLPNVSLARWLGGVRFDHHHPSLLKEVAGLCQAAPRRVLFQGAEVL